MRMLSLLLILSGFLYVVYGSLTIQNGACTLTPLGNGQDDTSDVLDAVAQCGMHGHITFGVGDYNITRRMLWNLSHTGVDMYGYLNFNPDVQYWLLNTSTWRQFEQDQARWFVISGDHFHIDAHNQGGIRGNGQVWWSYYLRNNLTKEDGDGRPISLTLQTVSYASINNFRIEDPPFWSNMIEDGHYVTYNGMYVNATNTDPRGFGTNQVANTDGIDTYRSDHITLQNWDVTCGDDCIAVKGNTTNLLATNITCRGGNGIAFGSLGQYNGVPDIVENVTISDVTNLRLDPLVQPLMQSAVYFKTWAGISLGTPPIGGGGGLGRVHNVTLRNFVLDRVDLPMSLYQADSEKYAGPGPAPNVTDTSKLAFSNLTFSNFRGTVSGKNGGLMVNIACSGAVPCPGVKFDNFWVAPYNATTTMTYECRNVLDIEGLPGPCNFYGTPGG